MIKKIIIVLTAVLILAAAILTFFRENIFISTVRIWLNNADNTSLEFVINKNGKTKTVTKSGLENKVKAKVGSTVTVNIPSDKINNIERLQNGYMRFNFDESKDYITLKNNGKTTTIEYNQPVTPTTKYLNILFERPFMVFIVLSLLLLTAVTGMYFYIKNGVQIYRKSGFDTDLKIFLLQTVFVCGIVLFIFQQIMDSYWWLDTSFNTLIAKNIALNGSYSYTFNGETKYFPPVITTGYPAMFFVAAFIKILSNKIWVPKLACSVMNLLLLAVTLYLPKFFKNITKLQLWGWRCIFVYLVTYTITNGLHIQAYSSSLLGELPAFYLIFISVILLFIAENKKYLYFIAGIAASLAYSTKVLSLLSLAPVVLFFIIYKLLQKENIKKLITDMLIYAAGFIIPLALFEIYKLIFLHNWSDYLQLKIDEIKMFNCMGSGIEAKHAPAFEKIGQLVSTTGILRFFILLLLPIYALYKFFTSKENRNTISTVVTALFFAGWCNMLWWMFMARFNWLRHYLIGFALFIAAIGLILFIINKKNKIVYTILLVLFLTMPANKDISLWHINKTYRQAAVENKDMLEATEFIKNHPDYNYFTITTKDWENRGFSSAYEVLYNFRDFPLYSANNQKYFNDKVKNKIIITKLAEIESRINKYYDAKAINEKYKDNVIFENDTYVFYNAD